VGLVLFAEQFAAAAYGIGLALTFVRRPPAPWYDWLLAAASLALLGYVTVYFPHLTAISGTLTPEIVTLSVAVTLLTLEATRRTIGWSLVIILLALAGYVLAGHLVPGRMQTREVGLADMLAYLNLDNNGLLGIILQITVIVIIPFVLMGQLLMR
jgi:TRAP-type uncharacterized transport system fused permease subunit